MYTKPNITNYLRGIQTPTTARLEGIPSGRAGVVATLDHMSAIIRAGRSSMPVRTLAIELTHRLPQKDYLAELQALFYFVRDRIRYIKDVAGLETLQTPDKTLELGAGDCDDKSILLASLLQSIGHESRLVAVGFMPGRFSHVYVEGKLGAKWIPMETTEPRPFGWYPQNAVEKIIKVIK